VSLTEGWVLGRHDQVRGAKERVPNDKVDPKVGHKWRSQGPMSLKPLRRGTKRHVPPIALEPHKDLA